MAMATCCTHKWVIWSDNLFTKLAAQVAVVDWNLMSAISSLIVISPEPYITSFPIKVNLLYT